jgi:hypothetical protein
MSITLDGFPEMPLHPLDLTTQSQTDPSSSDCVGLIQTDGGIMNTSPIVSDMILGVAFLRNVYTVMAYDAPNSHGVFPANNESANLQPRLGLLSLTNATRAMQEFNNVRILNEPLSSGNSDSPTSGASSRGKSSVGIDVLLALVGIIVACVALFGLRWFHVRRRLRQGLHTTYWRVDDVFARSQRIIVERGFGSRLVFWYEHRWQQRTHGGRSGRCRDR